MSDQTEQDKTMKYLRGVLESAPGIPQYVMAYLDGERNVMSLSKKYGVSRSNVYHSLIRYGVSLPKVVTEDVEKEVVEIYRRKGSIRATARESGINYNVVRGIIIRSGVVPIDVTDEPEATNRQPEGVNFAKVNALFDAGKSVKEISEETGITERSVQTHLNRGNKEWRKVTLKDRVDEVKTLAAQGKSVAEISREMDVPAPTIYGLINRRGLRVHRGKVGKPKNPRLHEMLALAREGKCVSEISRELGIPENTVRYNIVGRGAVFRVGKAGRPEHRKFPEMKRLAEDGKTLKEIAAATGVPRSTVLFALRRNGVDYVKKAAGRPRLDENAQ